MANPKPDHTKANEARRKGYETVKVTSRINADLIAALDEKAKELNLNRTEMLELALTEYAMRNIEDFVLVI